MFSFKVLSLNLTFIINYNLFTTSNCQLVPTSVNCMSKIRAKITVSPSVWFVYLNVVFGRSIFVCHFPYLLL